MASNRRRWLVVLLIAAGAGLLLFVQYRDLFTSRLDYQIMLEALPLKPACEVPQLISSRDDNKNGIPDPLDIVVFGAPLEHIAIVSDRRGRDGVPLLIHNAGPRAAEGHYLLNWSSPITYHFRYILYENEIS
ncbi:MAG TPA: DUF1287 domain-containing protein [Syntrophomonas sp.]|nr:DUF1287 domain-containing protein [Syntrophomonas sp.]